jgi:hypothetical protein
MNRSNRDLLLTLRVVALWRFLLLLRRLAVTFLIYLVLALLSFCDVREPTF